MNIADVLGPHAQPGPASMECTIAQGPDGTKLLVVINTIAGRTAVFLNPDEAGQWAQVLTKAAQQVSVTSPLVLPPNGLIPPGLRG